MKKLILLGVISLNVALSVDCNAMIKRYSNNPSALFKDCIDRNNANACFCGAAVTAQVVNMLMQKGDNDKANEWYKSVIALTKRACQLGKIESCKMLNEAGIGY